MARRREGSSSGSNYRKELAATRARRAAAGQNMKREIMKQGNDEYTSVLEGELENYLIWGPSGSLTL